MTGIKALIIIALAAMIFGGAYYATYLLYLQPQQAIQQEKQAPPAPPPPDPALPDYERIVGVQDGGDVLGARTSWQDFIERYPQSTKCDDAKDRLGQINISLFLSPVQTPDKQVYLVKPGDVINKVAARLKSTPELLMRSNNLQGSMLRIGQKLIVPPADFTLAIHRRERKVVVLQNAKFFRHYSILAMPSHHPAETDKKPAAKPPKLSGKITEKIAWNKGTRIPFTDKAYAEAEHWILLTPGGNNLYTQSPTEAGATPLPKPPGGGYGLAPESLRELAVLVRKGDAVTID